MPANDLKAYRVLALDGGGIRGLYTSTVLHEVAAFFAKQLGDSDLDVGKRFDLITGTSTGGILACGLAAGVAPQRISDLYKEEGPKIFGNPMPTAGFLAKAGYGKRAANHAANKAEPLRKALVGVFGDETLGALYERRGIAVCLPSIKMITQASKVFKTPHTSDLVIDRGYKLVDVCLATSAAPIFLPLAELEFPDSPGRVELFADGGLWANNPTLVGLIEALKICFEAESPEGARRPVEILSIGTCGLPEGDAPDAKVDRGILDWAVGIKIAGLAMNAQASAAACMAKILAQRVTELGRSIRIVRIANPPVSAEQAKHLQLDLATNDALSLLAQLGSQKAQQVMSDSGDRSNPNGQFHSRHFYHVNNENQEEHMKQNCSDDLIEFDQKKVKITPAQQTEMRKRRDTNRERLHTGLDKNRKPHPDEHIVQGSYAMKTMTQHPDREYDIDDGSAFASSKLLIAGVAMTPQQAKQMVCDALLAEGHGPEDIKVIKNCVRVTYEAGYHVDIPVYRTVSDGKGGKTMEIASENEWRKSNPREITEWFQREEKKTLVKGEEENPQMRRMTRLVKNYSRTNLGDDDSPTGLVLSVLTGELHKTYVSRDDEAFRSLLTNLKARLERDKVVKNPVHDEELTKPADAERITKLISQLGKSIERMKVLDTDCSKAEARAVWDDVFKTDFFQGRQESDQAAKGPYTPSVTEPDKRTSVRGPGTSA